MKILRYLKKHIYTNFLILKMLFSLMKLKHWATYCKDPFKKSLCILSYNMSVVLCNIMYDVYPWFPHLKVLPHVKIEKPVVNIKVTM